MSKWFPDRAFFSSIFTQIVSGGFVLPKKTGAFQRSGVLNTVPDRSLTFVGTSCARLLPVLISCKQTRVIFYSHRIMTNTKRSFTKAFASLVVAGLCLCFVPSVSYSTCPSTTPDFPLIGWVDGGCYLTTVDGCSVKICFCYRTVASVPRTDICITGIYPQTIDGNPCFGISWVAFINDVISSDQVIKDAIPHITWWTCPQCPNYTYTFNMTAISCWHILHFYDPVTNTTTTVSEACIDPQEWCTQGIAVCCDPTTGALTIWARGSKSHFGSACSLYFMPSANSNVAYDTCYETIDCG